MKKGGANVYFLIVCTISLMTLFAGYYLLAINQISTQSSSDINLSFVSPLEKVFKNKTISGNSSVIIKAAKNEYESFQIAMTASANISVINATISDLTGPSLISSSNATLYRVEYANVSTLSPSPEPGYTTGFYPDPLVPFIDPVNGWVINQSRGTEKYALPIDIPKGENRAIFVDVYVPKNTFAGNYTGTFSIKLSDSSISTIPISLTVWNFTLPDGPTMESSFASWRGYNYTIFYGYAKGTAQFNTIEQRYQDEIAKHRINPYVPLRLLPEGDSNGDLIPDAAKDAVLEELMNRDHITNIESPGESVSYTDPVKISNFFENIADYMNSHSWINYSYYWPIDEPNDADGYQYVVNHNTHYYTGTPNIRTLASEQTYPQNSSWPNISSYVDIWCPVFEFIDEGTINQKLAAGNTVWSYTALAPTVPTYHPQYATLKDKISVRWEIDRPLLNYRVPVWFNYRYKITGLLYYNMVTGGIPNPWINPSNTEYGGYNGDGQFFYPGTQCGFEGPVDSMRLKALRDGMEDYEYFILLQNSQNRTASLNYTTQVATEWWNYTNSSATIMSTRNKIGETLNSLNVESEAPIAINIAFPANNTNSSNSQLNVNYTIIGTPQACWWTNNSGKSNNSITCRTNITGKNWLEGINNLTVYANDTSGNVNSSSITFTIDTILPAVSIKTPLNNTNSSNNNLDVNYTVNDTHLKSCWYRNDSYTVNTSLANCSTNITAITWSEGVHNVRVYANDTAGNTNFTHVKFTIDTLPPSISILYPLNNTNTSNINLNINYTLGSDAQSCWYSNDSYTVNISLASCSNITSMTWSKSQHNVTVWADDSVNNVNSSSITFTIYNSPVISLISPADGTSTTQTTTAFTYTVIESLVTNCSLIINGVISNFNSSANIDGTSNSFANYTPIGNYLWSVNCTDLNNNQANSSSRSLTITNSSGTTTPSPPSGGGGGGGGITIVPAWVSTYSPTEDELIAGYEKKLIAKERVKINVKNETHYVGVKSLTSTEAKVEISSNPIQLTLGIGQRVSVDVNNDTLNEVYLQVSSISDNSVDLTIRVTDNQASNITEQNLSSQNISNENNSSIAETEKPSDSGKKFDFIPILFVFVVLFLVAVIVSILIKLKSSKNLALKTDDYVVKADSSSIK